MAAVPGLSAVLPTLFSDPGDHVPLPAAVVWRTFVRRRPTTCLVGAVHVAQLDFSWQGHGNLDFIKCTLVLGLQEAAEIDAKASSCYLTLDIPMCLCLHIPISQILCITSESLLVAWKLTEHPTPMAMIQHAQAIPTKSSVAT
jgi:hypothetical protein